MRETHRIFHFLIVTYAILCVLQLGTGFWLFGIRFGWTYQSAMLAFLGDTERFVPPRSFSGLLETAVPHLVAMGTVAFIISHFLPFLPGISTQKKWLIGLAIPLCAFLDIASGFLIRFVSPHFVLLKFAGFLGFEISVLAALGLIFFSAVQMKNQSSRKTRSSAKSEN